MLAAVGAAVVIMRFAAIGLFIISVIVASDLVCAVAIAVVVLIVVVVLVAIALVIVLPLPLQWPTVLPLHLPCSC